MNNHGLPVVPLLGQQQPRAGVNLVGFVRRLDADGLFEPAASRLLPDGSRHFGASREQVLDAEQLLGAIREQTREDLAAGLTALRDAVRQVVREEVAAALAERGQSP